MANVLIIATPGDVHAAAVRWVLGELGHDVALWSPDHRAEARFADDEISVALGGERLARVDTVWLRRLDRNAFAESMLGALGEMPFWVNHPRAQVCSKGAQLAAARRVGLRIPRTILTREVEEAERVPVAYELRVLVLGHRCIVARVSGRSGVEPYVLPAPVETRLVALLGQLGLVTGSVHLLVTPGGEHVFVEVNAQDDFLWLEEASPEVRVLEPFARFLVADRGVCAGLRFGEFVRLAA